MSSLVGGPIPTQAFKVRLNRRPSDAEVDSLRNHSDGAEMSHDGDDSTLRVSRDTETLSVAIAETLDDVATVPGLYVYWVEPLALDE